MGDVLASIILVVVILAVVGLVGLIGINLYLFIEMKKFSKRVEMNSSRLDGLEYGKSSMKREFEEKKKEHLARFEENRR